MEIVKQIREICIDTNNSGFLTRQFTKIALSDLELKETLEKEKNIMTFNDCECTCFTETRSQCVRCYVENERSLEIDKSNLHKSSENIYDYPTYYLKKSKWIIANKIDGKIPGFMLIKCCGSDIPGDFTHAIIFACVRPEYRRKGILKTMINQLPDHWNIWLEASSSDIENIEEIWKRCGFQYHRTMNSGHTLSNVKHVIYKKIGV